MARAVSTRQGPESGPRPRLEKCIVGFVLFRVPVRRKLIHGQGGAMSGTENCHNKMNYKSISFCVTKISCHYFSIPLHFFFQQLTNDKKQIFIALELLASSDGQGLHGEDLVHQFPGPEPILVDHVLPLVVTRRAVLVTHPVMS